MERAVNIGSVQSEEIYLYAVWVKIPVIDGSTVYSADLTLADFVLGDIGWRWSYEIKSAEGSLSADCKLE